MHLLIFTNPLYLLFEGKGLRVLENYKDDLNGFFKLKDNSNVNKDLNALAKLAEIDKRISFHTARHTNATLLIYHIYSLPNQKAASKVFPI